MSRLTPEREAEIRDLVRDKCPESMDRWKHQRIAANELLREIDAVRAERDDTPKLRSMLIDSATKVARLLAMLTADQRSKFWSEENARNLKPSATACPSCGADPCHRERGRCEDCGA